MAENKTQETDTAIEDFIASVEPEAKREDAKVLDALFRKVTGEEPKMWGPSIIGYGKYHYKYASGREGDWMRTGFSPRKAKHSLYLTGGYCDELAAGERKEILERLGKHSEGKSCLYINKLADIDLEVLEEMISNDWAHMNRIYPPE